MSQINYERLSVMHQFSAARAALVRAGLGEDDADSSLSILVARMPVDPFRLSALPIYFGELDAETRQLTPEQRLTRLHEEFGSDALRAAVILCEQYALAPKGVAL